MRLRRGWVCFWGALASAVFLACGGSGPSDPFDPQEALQRGWAAYEGGNFSAALLEFERAANLDAGLADAHNGVGWAHLSLAQGQPAEGTLLLALSAFERAVDRDDQLADAWVGLGQARFLRRSGRQELLDAAAALETALSAPRDSLFRHDYGSEAAIIALEAWCRHYAGDVDGAVRRASAALALEPELSAARTLINLP